MSFQAVRVAWEEEDWVFAWSLLVLKDLSLLLGRVPNAQKFLGLLMRVHSTAEDVDATLVDAASEVVDAGEAHTGKLDNGPVKGAHVEHVGVLDEASVDVAALLIAKASPTDQHDRVGGAQEMHSVLEAIFRGHSIGLNHGPGVTQPTH